MITAVDERATARSTSVATVRARVAIVLLVMILATTGVAYWLAHPGLVGEGGSEIGIQLELGQTSLTDAGLYPAGGGPLNGAVITVVSVEPRVLKNTADAKIELVVCHHSGDGTDVIGALREGDTEAPCTSVSSPAGAHESFPVSAQLLFRITPRQPGTVRVAGFDLVYQSGRYPHRYHHGGDSVMIKTTAA